MADKYRNFADLAEGDGTAFRIVVEQRDSSVAVIAPDGGAIEPTTSEISRAIAGDDYALYCFEGLIPGRKHGDLHITSERFDEPIGRQLVSACDFAVAVHGRKDVDDPEMVWLGGLDETLIAAAGEELAKSGFRSAVVTGALGGRAAANICNAGKSGRGMQLELPRSLRDRLRDDHAMMKTFANAICGAVQAKLADSSRGTAPKLVVWRTDARRFDPGAAMMSAGDHLAALNGSHAETERILRDAMGNGGTVRGTSPYTWADETWARRAWKYEPKKYLYRLEVDSADVRHRGDVNHYSDIGDVVKSGDPTITPVDDYIRGADSDRRNYPTSRFEVLVEKAIVLDRFDPLPK